MGLADKQLMYQQAIGCAAGTFRAAEAGWVWGGSVRKILTLAFPLMLSVGLSATVADIQGIVFNGTTTKPGVGDEVALLTLSQEGMKEIASTRADSRGRFRLLVPKPLATYLVRAIHQGVTYHDLVEPDSKPVVIRVYDTAPQLDGVKAIMDVQRFEATNDTLEVKQLVTVRNDSRPPRTLMNDRPFEIQLPPDAQVQAGLVQVEDGQPLKQKPIAGDRKGQYYFVFPVRPGDTRFAIVYRLPYNGVALIQPQLRNPLEKFVLMLPKSMKFDPVAAGIFHAMPDTTLDNVQGTEPMTSEQTLAFRISGTGMLEELKGRRQEAMDGKATSTISATRPGGGLAPPIDAPDPLQKYRWPILGSFALLAVVGAMYVTRRDKVSRAALDPEFVRRVRREAIRKQSRAQSKQRNRQQAHM